MSNTTKQTPTARQKILIVDDKKENLFALEKILTHADADVVQALDGQTALAQVLENDFALIVLDVRMPRAALASADYVLDLEDIGSLLKNMTTI